MPPRKIEPPRALLEQTRFRLVFNCVTGGDVCDLVSHYACELGFIIGREDESFVYVEETPWKGKRVYLVRIDDLDREQHLCIRVQDDILADAIHVLRDQGSSTNFAWR